MRLSMKRLSRDLPTAGAVSAVAGSGNHSTVWGKRPTMRVSSMGTEPHPRRGDGTGVQLPDAHELYEEAGMIVSPETLARMMDDSPRPTAALEAAVERRRGAASDEQFRAALSRAKHNWQETERRLAGR